MRTRVVSKQQPQLHHTEDGHQIICAAFDQASAPRHQAPRSGAGAKFMQLILGRVCNREKSASQ